MADFDGDGGLPATRSDAASSRGSPARSSSGSGGSARSARAAPRMDLSARLSEMSRSSMPELWSFGDGAADTAGSGASGAASGSAGEAGSPLRSLRTSLPALSGAGAGGGRGISSGMFGAASSSGFGEALLEGITDASPASPSDWLRVLTEAASADAEAGVDNNSNLDRDMELIMGFGAPSPVAAQNQHPELQPWLTLTELGGGHGGVELAPVDLEQFRARASSLDEEEERRRRDLSEEFETRRSLLRTLWQLESRQGVAYRAQWETLRLRQEALERDRTFFELALHQESEAMALERAELRATRDELQQEAAEARDGPRRAREEVQAMLQEVNELRCEQEELVVACDALRWEKRAMSTAGTAHDDVFVISLGGEHEVSVKRATLCIVESSMLACMFSGRWDSNLPRDAKGRVHLDVSPKIFCPILEHLRALAAEGPSTRAPPPRAPPGLESEFEQALSYWGLNSLSREIYRTPSRFLSEGKFWTFIGKPDAIRVQVDRDILLHGIATTACLHTSVGTVDSYKGHMTIYDPEGAVLHRQEVLHATAADGGLPEPVHLIPHVVLRKGVNYDVEVCLTGPPAKRGCSGQATVVSEQGITFTFSDSEKSVNGTNSIEGQIPAFLFALP
eukprot:TRINITY_DN71187_c0_g1_i1.p1 TRINITY_DN71187_c0_g1~~TRINITY_DN71187_c0_g1_i1.p1  ORF type:complete len:624 (-),score=152.28 TRINITY_DN71187_c0_g1_i1:172-2043(-)